MANSKLINHVALSPTTYGKRTHSVDTITPHCYVGQVTVESAGKHFANKLIKASCNYTIGKDGKVALIVDESIASCCSSNKANDERAITIECASASTAPYAFNDAVYNKLVDLCVDICNRYNKTKLIWIPDKEKALAYKLKSDEMRITVHRWFKNKACPGDWLYSRLGKLAETVTAKLSTPETSKPVAESSKPVATSPKPTTTKANVKVAVPVIKVGCRGENVKTLQRNINTVMKSGLVVDGSCGPATVNAIKAFQKKYKLSVDGSYGPASANKLKSLLSK